ncbi:LOW QUALITY PROTEIN: putative gustatory receptor 58b [Drosophila busckii]|uniref:LOW QUALITY PROTEIN: putative gustatory receptor 58b n=1 Tax=Drosophila busckii TaxID=30019 RepID=UPI001433004D|nr:LOW QUALITY PROTEIN: putative gustatory receptor 58b [Drosophila busckii]
MATKLRVLLSICYYQLLLYGLMPTTLQLNKCRLTINKVSGGYLVYSGALDLLLTLGLPLMLPRGIFSGGYMRNNIVLQWGLMVSVSLRALVLLNCLGMVWWQRRKLLQLLANCLKHWQRQRRLLRRVAGKRALQRLQSQLANMLLHQLCINYAMLLCSMFMQYQLLQAPRLFQLLLRSSHMLLQSVAKIGFITMLLLLSHQFEAVQLALQALQRRSRGHARTLEDLRRIIAVHMECLQLTRHAFGTYSLAHGTLILNMFSATLTIIYHAVQYTNQSISSNNWDILFGDLLVSFNIWNVVMMMNILDYALNSCNNTGQLLQQFNELRRLSAESELQLELFVNYLRNNRLDYKVFNCVALDKPAMLGFMASVLSNLLILMQFDVKRRQEQGLQASNLFGHLNAKGSKVP